MAITITVDGVAITSDWQAQQESNPADPQPIFISSDDKTTAAPVATLGAAATAAPKTRTAKK